MNTSLRGKKVLIVGMARSGLAASEFVQKKGAAVKVSDKRPADRLRKEIQRLEASGIACETGRHETESFLEADLIVVSPGVPLRIPELQQAVQAGKTVISEVELASWFLQGKVVGITGSNGKTTTTALVGEILKVAGFKVQVGGNIGTALTSLVETSRPETFTIVELSSFQLEAIPTFRPDVAVVLNLTPDHLDRYDSFEDYVQAKLNIFKNQGESDYAVLNFEDPILRKAGGSLKSQTFWFSRSREVAKGTGFDGKHLVFKRDGLVEPIITAEQILLKGLHNVENIAAAATAARLVEAPAARIGEAIARFKGVEHRLEWVADIKGVQFYNDSKATNTDATIKALEAFDKGVVLILGGRDKGSDYSVLRPLVKQRVKTILLIGEAGKKISSQLEGAVPTRQVGSLEEAVSVGYQHASSGDVVLLAPACASFDMFEDFEHRGRVFKAAVRGLLEKQEG